jgi:hypothetical protein
VNKRPCFSSSGSWLWKTSIIVVCYGDADTIGPICMCESYPTNFFPAQLLRVLLAIGVIPTYPSRDQPAPTTTLVPLIVPPKWGGLAATTHSEHMPLSFLPRKRTQCRLLHRWCSAAAGPKRGTLLRLGTCKSSPASKGPCLSCLSLYSNVRLGAEVYQPPICRGL